MVRILIRAIIYLTRPRLFANILTVRHDMSKDPKSLQEAIIYFSNPDNCVDYFAIRRWPNGITCPGYGSEKVKFNPNRRTWQCASHHAKSEFSVKVGTVMEDSAISLNKWLIA